MAEEFHSLPHQQEGAFEARILDNEDSQPVTDPSRTFTMHTWPLFPVISTCISVPLVHHCLVDYCYYVCWSCEYLWCVFWFSCHCGLRRWLRVSSRVIIIVRLCYLFKILLTLLFGFLPCVLYTCLFGLRPCAFTWHAVIWGKYILKTITHSCACPPIPSCQRDTANVNLYKSGTVMVQGNHKQW
jgi:hypothetical protein